MSQQMSLFPTKDVSDEKSSLFEGDGNAIDEVFSATHRFRSSREYLRMLQVISRFSNYSAFNGFLLFIQNPELTYVATAGTWRRRFRRDLKPGARPLLILAPMSPVRFVFDLNDTAGETFPSEGQRQDAAIGGFTEEIFENTVHNCALHGIMVRQVETSARTNGSAVPLCDDVRQKYPELDLDAGMKYLILLYRDHRLEDKYRAMAHELGQIFCGHRGIDRNAWWPDRRKAEPAVAKLEAASIAFLICRRIGIFISADRCFADYQGKDQMLPLLGLNAVLQATSYIEEMGRSRWQKPRKSR
ncbi:MAG: hypothetical protein P1P89_18510 [Desulfobacterales bacterium]|nr:hypothetical protein [Desulfobacterales bacterium]